MAQGDFTKQEARLIKEVVEDIYKDLPKSKKMDHVGSLNDIFLFLSAAERNAPDEEEVKT